MTKEEEFRKFSHYAYRIKWWDDSVFLLENGDAPELLLFETPNCVAIISGANPNGKLLSVKDNKKRNEKLRLMLKACGYTYLDVERLSIKPVTFEIDSREKVDAFFVYEIPESYAKRIAASFGQEALVFFEKDLNLDITIYLMGIGKFRGQKAILFTQR